MHTSANTRIHGKQQNTVQKEKSIKFTTSTYIVHFAVFIGCNVQLPPLLLRYNEMLSNPV